MLTNIMNNEDYKSYLKGKTIVMFAAAHCCPSKKVKPWVLELEKETDVNVIMIDIQYNIQLTYSDENITGTPHLKLYNEKDLVEEISGFVSKEDLMEKLDKIKKWVK